MKILQVMAGAAHGGAETAFIDTCLALDEAGEQIEVVTRPNPMRLARLEKAGIKVHELAFGGLWDIHTSYKIKRIIEDFKPQIVQTWMQRASQKTPCWSKGDKTDPYLTVARLGGYYKLKYFKNTNYFMTITPDIRRYLIEKGVEESKVKHINNFAETEEVITPVEREDYNVPAGKPLLLTLGRLHKAKALDTLMAAIKDLPDVYLWIAGEGPDREKLESLRDDLGLQERVTFLGWRDDRAALLEAADICVFPSRYEPFGTVFVQAWAHKTPLITSDADGPRQYVIDGEDGLVFPVDDVAALRQAIEKLAGDEDFADRLIARGWHRYKNEFTREKTVGEYLDYYHHILEKEGFSEVL